MNKQVGVLGVDLSGFSCGYAVLDGKGRLPLHGVIAPAEKLPYWQRQSEIAAQLTDIIITHKPPCQTNLGIVVIERIRLFHHGKISLAAIEDLARLSGVVGYLATQHGLEIETVHTNHWRKRVLGNGRAMKDDVVKWIMEEYELEAVESDDEAEAIALALYGSLIQKDRVKNGEGSRART